MIYLDYNATTPVDESVLEAMLPWMADRHWNAASGHAGGRAAADAVEAAREDVARLIGARRSEIVWTSGATEANNLALKGAIHPTGGGRRRLVTAATEHKAVLDVAAWLGAAGGPTTVLPVVPDGSMSLDDLEAELAVGDVALVSVMAANNETGVLADLGSLSELAHRHGALIHTDATQMIGKLPFSVRELDVDLASMSAHKTYGPKGVGALFVSRRCRLDPLIHGGGHERGLRSGTLNVPGIVGFGAAARVFARLSDEAARQEALRDSFVTAIQEHVDQAELIASGTRRLPNTANVRFVGADAEAVMANAPDVLVSSGSACTALTPEPSHVLVAMGLTREEAGECLRVSIGRPTTTAEIASAVGALAASVERVRSLQGQKP